MENVGGQNDWPVEDGLIAEDPVVGGEDQFEVVDAVVDWMLGGAADLGQVDKLYFLMGGYQHAEEQGQEEYFGHVFAIFFYYRTPNISDDIFVNHV